MKVQHKRIHGKLLMITGIVHVLLVIFPGVFGKQFFQFAKNISLVFISVSLLGAYMIPLSGMTFLLLPQGIYMYLRSSKVS